MQKARLIINDRGIFADEMVNEVSKRTKMYVIDCRNQEYIFNNHFLYSSMPLETQLIVFDNMPLASIVRLFNLIGKPQLVIDRKGFDPFYIPRPAVMVFAKGDRRGLKKFKAASFNSRFFLMN